MNRSGEPETEETAPRAKGAQGRTLGVGRDFLGLLGRLVIQWGDIEALTRTLELMQGQGLRYRAKTDAELNEEYRPERRPFDKHLKAVLPHQTAMAQGILRLKELRDFALHGALIKWSNTDGEKDAIVHVDAPAMIFAQGGFMSRPLTTIIPQAGMLRRGDGELEPAIVTSDGLRRACDKLAGYVYDLRLFRTILEVKGGAEIRFGVSGAGRGQRSRSHRKSAAAAEGFPRSIESSVFQNPADEIGHDAATALRLGEFCQSFALLDQTVRTLEIMRAGAPGEFQAHREPQVDAWYAESPRQLTARLNFVLGRESQGAVTLSALVRFRNFVYHNPISMMEDGSPAAFVHRDLVALRDARPRPDAEKNEVRPVPDWALRRHAGTTHVPVAELAMRTEEARVWQERLIQLIEQGHREAGRDEPMFAQRSDVPERTPR